MKNAAAEVLNEVFQDTQEVVETANKNGLITPKRLLIAGGLALVVATTVVIVKKIRAAKAEDEQA